MHTHACVHACVRTYMRPCIHACVNTYTQVVEAYFGRAHEQRRQFMSSNPGMSPPLLELDLMNWEAPLSCVVGAC